MREIWESLELDTTPRPHSGNDDVGRGDRPAGDSDVTVFVDGHETLAGPLDRLLTSLGLTVDDLE